MSNEDSYTSIVDTLLHEDTAWARFHREAFEAANSPDGLSLRDLTIEPVIFDKRAYQYLEESNNALLDEAISYFASGAFYGHGFESLELFSDFSRVADWQSAWKQCSPLIAFTKAFGGNVKELRHPLSAFIFTQAIPATEFDMQLDEVKHPNRNPKWQGVVCIATSALQSSLESLERGTMLARCLRQHSANMYARMISQAARAYEVSTLRQSPDLYVRKDAGVKSSVFFRIGVEWAAILSDPRLLETARELGDMLATVRQLNDELLDWSVDVQRGLVTLPIIFAAADSRHGKDVIDLIQRAWRHRTWAHSDSDQLEQLVHSTDALARAANVSAEILFKACSLIARNINPKLGFDACCLLGLRIGVLKRLKMGAWRDVSRTALYTPWPDCRWRNPS